MTYRFYGWVVEYGNGLHLFMSADEQQNDLARVELTAQRLHGVWMELYIPVPV